MTRERRRRSRGPLLLVPSFSSSVGVVWSVVGVVVALAAVLVLDGGPTTFVEAEPCSGTVVINSTSGTITDHTGGGNYTRPESCNWSIRAPDANSQITLVFNYFDSYGDAARQQFDFLDIKQGGISAPDFVWFYGYNQNIPAIVSSTSSLFLLWRTWSISSLPTGKGFELQYSISSCPNQCNWRDNQGYCFNSQCYCSGGWSGPACDIPTCANDCGGSARGSCVNGRCKCKPGFYGGDCLAALCDPLTVFTDSNVANFSDHHDGYVGTNPYYRETNCGWLIQPDGASRVSLQFAAFDLEQDWDFLDVFDGSSTTAPLLYHLSGSSIPPQIVSSGPSMYLHFYTDTGVDSVGFTASYTALNAPASSNVPVSTVTVTATSTVTATVTATVETTVTATVTVQVNNTLPPEDHPPHHFLFTFIGMLIGIALALGGAFGYQKWKERNEGADTVKFEAVPQDAPVDF